MFSSVPSYLYSGIDSRTKSLQNDLEELGGGDTRLTNMDLHVIIDDLRGRNKSKILWQLDNFLGLKDPLAQNTLTPSKSISMTYYPVTSVQTISSMLSLSESDSKPLEEEISDWALDGFNSCIIAYGASGSGKTLSIFGPKEKSDKFPKCLTEKIIAYLYDMKKEKKITLGLSCWALKNNEFVDLCEETRSSILLQDSSSIHKTPCIIECLDEFVAFQILKTARSKCKGVLPVDSSMNHKDANKAHFFCRFTIFQPSSLSDDVNSPSNKGIISHINIIDLIGTSPIEDREFNLLSEDDREARRETALQHQALIKVIHEMKELSRAANSIDYVLHPLVSPTQPKVTSARDSKLTRMIAPLLQGNAKTSILLYLKDEESQYKHCKSALNSFKNLSEIVSACHITRNIDKSSLAFRHPDRVLPPKPQLYDQKPIYAKGSHHDVDTSYRLIDFLEPEDKISDHEPMTQTENITEVASGKIAKIMGEFREIMSSIDSKNNPRSSSLLLSPRTNSNYFTSPDVNDKTILGDLVEEEDQESFYDEGIEGEMSDYIVDSFSNQYLPAPDGNNPAALEQNYYYSSSSSLPPPPPSPARAQAVGSRYDDCPSPELRPNATPPTHTPHRPSLISDGLASLLFLAAEPFPLSSETEAETQIQKQEQEQTFTTGNQGIIIPENYTKIKKQFEIFPRIEENETLNAILPPPPPTTTTTTTTLPTSRTMQFSLPFDKDQEFSVSSSKFDQMTQTNESLLEALYIEKKEHESIKQKYTILQSDIAELNATKDIEIDQCKIEIIRLKSKLRQVSADKSIADIYDNFEEDLKRLMSENDVLRRRNLLLEEKCIAYDVEGVSIHRNLSTKNKTTDNTTRNRKKIKDNDRLDEITEEKVIEANDRVSIAALRTKLRNVSRENVILKSENEDMRKKERFSLIAERLSAENVKRIALLNSEYRKIQRALEAEKEAAVKRDKELNLLYMHKKQLEDSENSLKDERINFLATISNLQKQVIDISQDKKNIDKLNRFIEKHTYSSHNNKEKNLWNTNKSYGKNSNNK